MNATPTVTEQILFVADRTLVVEHLGFRIIGRDGSGPAEIRFAIRPDEGTYVDDVSCTLGRARKQGLTRAGSRNEWEEMTALDSLSDPDAAWTCQLADEQLACERRGGFYADARNVLKPGESLAVTFDSGLNAGMQVVVEARFTPHRL